MLHDRKAKLFPKRKRSKRRPLFLQTKWRFYQALFPTNRVKGRKTSRDQSHFSLARATYTVQVLQCTCSRAVAALQQPLGLARPKLNHADSRFTFTFESVDRRARRVFALFPSDSTFISHRWQFARSFQKVFSPPHFFVKNTTTVFFFECD